MLNKPISQQALTLILGIANSRKLGTSKTPLLKNKRTALKVHAGYYIERTKTTTSSLSRWKTFTQSYNNSLLMSKTKANLQLRFMWLPHQFLARDQDLIWSSIMSHCSTCISNRTQSSKGLNLSKTIANKIRKSLQMIWLQLWMITWEDRAMSTTSG